LTGAVALAALLTRSGALAQEAAPAFSVTFPTSAAAAMPGDSLTFQVTNPGADGVYIWVFGDGAPPMSGAKVTHSFARVDDFTVRLTKQQGMTQTQIGTRTIRVQPEFRGVFAADIDGQFTPADQIQMSVAVRAPGLSDIDVRTGGTLIAARTAHFKPTNGVDFMVLNDMDIADESNAIVREDLLKKPRASLPLDGSSFSVALDYTPPSGGATVTLNYPAPVRDFFHPEQTIAVTYPNISAFAGKPDDPLMRDDYYMKGDADFSHPSDYYVRKLALQWGRRGGAWPDDPQQVAMNIFRTEDALLDDGEPASFNNDYNIARLFDSGDLSSAHRNEKFICIAQAYLFTALSRTLGMPAREINNAIGEPSYQDAEGVWHVRWWQEGGAEVWYNGDWHYFDTFVGATDRQTYLAKNLIYQSWAAFDPQAVQFMTVNGVPTGLKGHDFSRWPGDPPQWTFLGEGVRPGLTVEGMVSGPPVTAAGDDGSVELRTLTPAFAAPSAAGIAALPRLPAADSDTP
jgi:hypothetical protein